MCVYSEACLCQLVVIICKLTQFTCLVFQPLLLSLTPSLSYIPLLSPSLSPKLLYCAHLLKSTTTKQARENVVFAVSPWPPLAAHCTHANAAHCALVCLCLIAKCNCLLSLMLMLLLPQLLLLLFLTWPTCALLDIRFTFFGALPKPATNRQSAIANWLLLTSLSLADEQHKKKG